MGFWGDFGGRGEDIWWKVHPSSELRVFRHLWSRSDSQTVIHHWSDHRQLTALAPAGIDR